MKKLLLHVCCGVCSGWPIEKLRADGYEVTCFFYNPNIAPYEEYARRRDASRAAAEIYGCAFLEGEYDNDRWRTYVRGMEHQPEGFGRCAVCFRMRLARCRAKAEDIGADFFATTLTVSAHKNAACVNAIGVFLSPNRFLVEDFKKQDGFKKTSIFARTHSLYRQTYCGCTFSTEGIKK